jgi:hypothetical protein
MIFKLKRPQRLQRWRRPRPLPQKSKPTASSTSSPNWPSSHSRSRHNSRCVVSCHDLGNTEQLVESVCVSRMGCPLAPRPLPNQFPFLSGDEESSTAVRQSNISTGTSLALGPSIAPRQGPSAHITVLLLRWPCSVIACRRSPHTTLTFSESQTRPSSCSHRRRHLPATRRG